MLSQLQSIRLKCGGKLGSHQLSRKVKLIMTLNLIYTHNNDNRTKK